MSAPSKLLESRRSFLINLAYFAVCIAIGVLVVRYLAMWMMPFVFAFLVAALLQKPLKWLVKVTKGGRKVFSVALVVLMVLVLAGLVALISWRIVVWGVGIVGNKDNLQIVQTTLNDIGVVLQDFLVRITDELPASVVASLTEGVTSLLAQVGQLITSSLTATASFALNLTTKLPSVLLAFIMWIMASIFLTIDFHKVTGFFLRQLPDRHADLVMQIRELFTNTIFKLLKAYALLMFITFVELSICMLILGMEHPFLLAALIALVDILPVLGTGTVLIPWAVVSLILGKFPMAIGLVVVYIVITVVRNVLEPRLISYQIGLNPLVTLFFMYLGLQAAGVLGMFLFPVTVMVAVQLQERGHIHLWK